MSLYTYPDKEQPLLKNAAREREREREREKRNEINDRRYHTSQNTFSWRLPFFFMCTSAYLAVPS